MKKFIFAGTVIALLSACTFAFGQSNNQPNWNSPAGAPIRLGVVKTKKCLDESKMGKHEQANLEKMKDQMMTVLQDKGKAYQEIESKLNDEDYMDSISSEAEADLKRKRKQLREEGMELQSQYAETFQYARLKSIDKLGEVVSKASDLVAKENNIDVMLTDEATTFYANTLDLTDKVIAKMNVLFEQEQKEAKNNPTK